MEKYSLRIYDENGEYVTDSLIAIDNTALACPSCRTKVKPIFKFGEYYRTPGLSLAKAVFSCPECTSWITCEYEEPFDHNESMERYKIVGSTEENFDPLIKKISPKFHEIYGEACGIERLGFKHSGIIYRKSLEFLIKDYAIQTNSGNAEKIKRKFLGNVIKEDLDLKLLKDCAQRASWLANDETHYTRKHENLNITDLKRLISLSVHVILANEYAKSYESEMESDKS